VAGGESLEPSSSQTFALLQRDRKSVKVTREIDGGLETVQGTLPMIVTTDLRFVPFKSLLLHLAL
jgi:hypothetical protein